MKARHAKPGPVARVLRELFAAVRYSGVVLAVAAAGAVAVVAIGCGNQARHDSRVTPPPSPAPVVTSLAHVFPPAAGRVNTWVRHQEANCARQVKDGQVYLNDCNSGWLKDKPVPPLP